MAGSGGSGPGSEPSQRALPPRISAAASASTLMMTFRCLVLQFESHECVEICGNFSEFPNMNLD